MGKSHSNDATQVSKPKPCEMETSYIWTLQPNSMHNKKLVTADSVCHGATVHDGGESWVVIHCQDFRFYISQSNRTNCVIYDRVPTLTGLYDKGESQPIHSRFHQI